jgi:peptidoglycan L-alanyl-D-glutamate endopeptidase CwlK
MFKFSSRSFARLEGVHPDLAELLIKAIEESVIDFGVVEGVRTLESQRLMVERKVSQTMNSKHLIQEDGWGHAVDLVPYLGTKSSWEWRYIFEMTLAIQRTLRNRDTAYPRIRWGGAWTCLNTVKRPKQLQAAYVERCTRLGKTPFLDGPHFEILDPRMV